MTNKLIIDIETTGLNGVLDRITCISLLDYETDRIDSFMDEDEKLILTQFWDYFNELDTLVGYNLDDFDIPFIIKRSLVNHIKIKKISPIIDVMKIVNSYKYRSLGKLDDWSFVLTGEKKEEDGKKCIEYYENKEWTKIKKHCEEDVKITKLLYNRCLYCGLVK